MNYCDCKNKSYDEEEIKEKAIIMAKHAVSMIFEMDSYQKEINKEIIIMRNMLNDVNDKIIEHSKGVQRVYDKFIELEEKFNKIEEKFYSKVTDVFKNKG